MQMGKDNIYYPKKQKLYMCLHIKRLVRIYTQQLEFIDYLNFLTCRQDCRI